MGHAHSPEAVTQNWSNSSTVMVAFDSADMGLKAT